MRSFFAPRLIDAFGGTRRQSEARITGGMTSDRCEIFDMRRKGKLRWKWRHTAADGAVACSDEEYELFYECLSAARKKGFTPTYAGLRMFQEGDPSGLRSHSAPR